LSANCVIEAKFFISAKLTPDFGFFAFVYFFKGAQEGFAVSDIGFRIYLLKGWNVAKLECCRTSENPKSKFRNPQLSKIIRISKLQRDQGGQLF